MINFLTAVVIILLLLNLFMLYTAYSIHRWAGQVLDHSNEVIDQNKQIIALSEHYRDVIKQIAEGEGYD